MNYSNSTAQCYSRNGIMNEACKSMTIMTPPAFDVSFGLSNTHILRAEINYITKDEIVFGGSVGLRPDKIRLSNLNQEDASVNASLGYNLAGCIIIGITGGVVHYTKYSAIKDIQMKSTDIKTNIGMYLKVISTYTSFPITFGCYGNSAEIGITIGTIF